MNTKITMVIRAYVMVLALLLGGAVLAPAVSGANPVSDAVGQCQNGGWEVLVREDGTSFRNMGECVRHAAQGYAYGGDTDDDTTSEPEEPPLEGDGATLEITDHRFPESTWGTCTYYAWLHDVSADMPYVQVYHNDVPRFAQPQSSWREDDSLPWDWTWSQIHTVDTVTYVEFYAKTSDGFVLIATTNTETCAYEG